MLLTCPSGNAGGKASLTACLLLPLHARYYLTLFAPRDFAAPQRLDCYLAMGTAITPLWRARARAKPTPEHHETGGLHYAESPVSVTKGCVLPPTRYRHRSVHLLVGEHAAASLFYHRCLPPCPCSWPFLALNIWDGRSFACRLWWDAAQATCHTRQMPLMLK